ncbi:MAG TPA: electron transfer flavoprotein subunit alpha/FixB family protein [Thermoanaerobaculia bacterium]|nr:electron transfer flavoprotein subunit alpha/FixB family protein [Thermoanaerobaculia bacterium]
MTSILVYCDLKDGQIRKGSREALTIGRTLAEGSGGELAAVALGPAAASMAESVGRHGAKRLHVVSDPSLETYNTELYTAALAEVAGKVSPGVILMAASSAGKDLAPRLAARLGAGAGSEVIGLEWADGKLRARRPVYSGKAIATVDLDPVPAIVTCRANAFPAEETGGGVAEVIEVTLQLPASRVRVVEVRQPEAGELSIAEADIIVSGGRGLKDPANYALIRDLANALGGAVGASRATVDAGWIDHQHQVGQTGRVVSPNLYLAIGISGAIQHLAGMQTSKHIIAINKDPEAPIFKLADLGVVGDLFEIVPALTEEVRKAKTG